MSKRHTHIATAVLAFAGSAAASNSSNAAEPCPSSSTSPCAATTTPAPAPAAAPARAPLFQLLSEQAAKLPEVPNDPAPWFSPADSAPPSYVTAPLAIKPADDGFTAKSSVSSWRDYNAQMLSRRIEAAKTAGPSDLKVPKAPAVQPSPLDLWGSYGVDYLEQTGKEKKRTGVGADYKLTKTTTTGVSLEQSEQAASSTAAASVDRKVSAYASSGTKTILKLDASAETVERAASPLDAGENKTTLGVSPRVAHKFALDQGKTLEPFVRYEQKMSLGAAPLQAPNAGPEFSETAGAGLTYAKPDSFSLSATTDVEQPGALGGPAAPDVKSKLQLTLPLR